MKQILPILLILTGFIGTTRSQAQLTSPDTLSDFTFSYFVNGVPTITPVVPTGFIQFPDTNAGKTANITFLVANTSATQRPFTLTNAAVTGAGFSLLSTQTAVPIGGTGSLQLSFSPTASNPQQTTGAFQFQLISDTGITFSVFINLFGNVLQPKLILSYVDPVTGNQVAISQGGLIQFPKTALQATSVARVVVTNTGNGTGTVDSVAVNGNGYTLTSEPLTPATVAAGGTFTAGITFAPLAIAEYKGTATISVGGVVTTINLDGQGTNSVFTYTLLSPNGNQSLKPNGSISFPDTPADGVSKNSVTIQVQNTGNQAGAVSTIQTAGSDFQVSNLPVLPDTLNPGDIAVFNVVYQPAKAGASTGRLQIGSDLFNLTGNALGSLLTVSVDAGLGATPVQNGSIVAIPITVVGASRSITVSVANTGNLSTTVTGIVVTGTGFSVPNPIGSTTVAAGQTIQFSLQFLPTTLTASNGTVTIAGLSFTLLGTVQQPPALPAISFTNVPNVLAPLQQPSAGIQLASTYPYDVSGVLTLSFLPDSFVDDPAIEFATGTRTLNFLIPANTTQAIFSQASGASLGSLALFQTGTESGSVSLTAANFTVFGINVNPTILPSKSFQIPASVPQLRSVNIKSIANGQIVLVINGYSTPRNLSTLSFQFTGASGANLTTPSLTLDVSSAFIAWYESAASDVYGGQFSVTVTLTLTGDPTALQSVSVTATNSKGTSAAQSVTVPTV